MFLKASCIYNLVYAIKLHLKVHFHEILH
uniref:Uncharacterized protein n=1 Tax=Anguilla anguilla TaxID=7936 RepID=A0A0E9SY99_ANGAN